MCSPPRPVRGQVACQPSTGNRSHISVGHQICPFHFSSSALTQACHLHPLGQPLPPFLGQLLQPFKVSCFRFLFPVLSPDSCWSVCSKTQAWVCPPVRVLPRVPVVCKSCFGSRAGHARLCTVWPSLSALPFPLPTPRASCKLPARSVLLQPCLLACSALSACRPVLKPLVPQRMREPLPSRSLPCLFPVSLCHRRPLVFLTS